MGSVEPETTSSEKSGPDKWEIESAASTLIKAEEIKKNTTLYPLALAEIEKQQEATSQILAGKEVQAKVKKKLSDIFKRG